MNKPIMLQVITITDATTWNRELARFPSAHILQTWEWGAFKQHSTGWTAEHLLFRHPDGHLCAAAMLLTRHIGPFRVIYSPRGPIFANHALETITPVLDHLRHLARKRRAIWLKIDPDIPDALGLTDENQPAAPHHAGQAIQAYLTTQKWRFSSDQVQFRNTLTLDLNQTEDELLAGMSQSTRRKIRLAEKQGITVREAQSEADLQRLYEIYATTGTRQGFIVRPLDYYLNLWQSFQKAGLAHILVAEHNDNILAGIVLFHFGQTVWYFYGMSSNEHRDLQPNYALQWTAIRWAKSRGYQTYDWWGAPNEFNENDSMWGVFRFKQGFGSQVVHGIGAWDSVPFPPLYWLYMKVMPRIINFLRRKGKGNPDESAIPPA